MLGTVPKLKEMGIKWATLDDRLVPYGDWNPRHETFPGDSIKKMNDDFHKDGFSCSCGGCHSAWKTARGTMGVA
jgi:hypothetical protein